MENLYYKEILKNQNILENYNFYRSQLMDNQNSCKNHLPVILGYKNIDIYSGDELVKALDKKCLFCGKDVSFDKEFEHEINAFEYKKNEYTPYDYEFKYLELLQIFKEITLMNSYDESIKEFQNYINRYNEEKTRKLITKK